MTQMKSTVISFGKARKTFLVAIFLMLALVVLLNMTKPDKGEAVAQMPGGGEKPPTLVRVETVGTLTGTQPVDKVAPVVAKEIVELVPRVSGYLEKVSFQEGDYVKEGDLLFEIEDTIYQINVDIAKAVVTQIEAELALAKQNQERVEKLAPGSAMTKQDVDEAQRNVKFQEGRLQEAKARLHQAETDLGYTKIYAPLSGRIGRKQFSEGNYLTPQSGVLATIRQFSPITVEFPVLEKEFMTYFQDSGENKEAKIEMVMANGKPYEGKFKIDFLDNFVDRNSNQIMVYLICENEDDKLLPGGFSTVRLSEQFAEPKTAANVAALLTDGTTHYVYVVGKGNKLERRDVTLGEQVYDRQIITSGLTPGEKIVVGGTNKVRPDDIIRPIEAPSPAARASQPEQQLAVSEATANDSADKTIAGSDAVVAQPAVAVAQPVQPVSPNRAPAPPVAIAQPIGTADTQTVSQ